MEKCNSREETSTIDLRSCSRCLRSFEPITQCARSAAIAPARSGRDSSQLAYPRAPWNQLRRATARLDPEQPSEWLHTIELLLTEKRGEIKPGLLITKQTGQYD